MSEITLNKFADADGNVSVDTIAAIGKALGRDPATFLFEQSDSQHQPA
ncbi:hypothetical protein ABID26_004602 [Mesorhizobium shonense]|uniref:HTH cro/C1-type domain-containing protein n=1 Tax=Mesorhizobium shonense TaxID=1209948 RepID=A0ABV2HX32_9HYPH